MVFSSLSFTYSVEPLKKPRNTYNMTRGKRWNNERMTPKKGFMRYEHSVEILMAGLSCFRSGHKARDVILRLLLAPRPFWPKMSKKGTGFFTIQPNIGGRCGGQETQERVPRPVDRSSHEGLNWKIYRFTHKIFVSSCLYSALWSKGFLI